MSEDSDRLARLKKLADDLDAVRAAATDAMQHVKAAARAAERVVADDMRPRNARKASPARHTRKRPKRSP